MREPTFSCNNDTGIPDPPIYLFRGIQKSTGKVYVEDSLEHSPTHVETFYKEHEKPSMAVFEVILREPNYHLPDDTRPDLPEMDDYVLSPYTGVENYNGSSVYWGDAYIIRWGSHSHPYFAFVDIDNKEGNVFKLYLETGRDKLNAIIPFRDIAVSDYDSWAPFHWKDCVALGNIYQSKKELQERADFVAEKVFETDKRIEHWPDWIRQ